MNEIFDILLDSSKNIIVFTGAGISLKSGLPLASSLIKHLINIITPNDIQLEHILDHQNLPFEAYIENMINHTDDYSIFNMFSDKSIMPNEVHYYLSLLLKFNYISKIFTVNFDLLHEKSLNYIRCKYNKLFSENHFSEETYYDTENNLIKLHGCGSDIESMKFVLSSVTNVKNRKHRDIMTRLLFGDKNNVVVILGYSASDYFDIIPTVTGITGERATIIYVQHTNKSKKVSINVNDTLKGYSCDNKTGYPFSKFPGFFITENTQEFVESWIEKSMTQRVVKLVRFCTNLHCKKNHYNWENNIAHFSNSIKRVDLKLLGSLYFQATLYNESKTCFYRLSKKNSDDAFPFQQLAQLALIQKDYESYKHNIDIAKVLAQKNNDITVYINCLFNIAEFNMQCGHYKEAIDLYTESYKSASESFDLYRKMKSLLGLTCAFAEFGDLQKAKSYGNELLEMSEDETDLYIATDALLNIAELYRKNKDFNKAIEWVNNVINKKEHLHDYNSVIIAYMTLGNIYRDLKKVDDALKAYQKAENLAVKWEIPDLKGRIYHQIGKLLISNNIINQDCLSYLLKSLVEFQQLGNSLIVISCLEMLCGFFRCVISNMYKVLPLNSKQEIRNIIQPFEMEELLTQETNYSIEGAMLLYNRIQESTTDRQRINLIEQIRIIYKGYLSQNFKICSELADKTMYNKALLFYRSVGDIT